MNDMAGSSPRELAPAAGSRTPRPCRPGSRNCGRCGSWFPMSCATAAGPPRPLSRSLVASAATLVVPVAVRRMIDFGFHRRAHRADRPVFRRDDRDRRGARDRQRVALLPGHHARRAGGGGSAQRRCSRHLTTLSAPFFDTAKTGELTSRLTADTTQIKSAVGSSVSVALRNLVLFVGSADHDGDHQPEAVGLRARRDSGDRAAAGRRSAARCGGARAPRRTRWPTPRPMPPN